MASPCIQIKIQTPRVTVLDFCNSLSSLQLLLAFVTHWLLLSDLPSSLNVKFFATVVALHVLFLPPEVVFPLLFASWALSRPLGPS